MRTGLICNVADSTQDRWEERDQEPCFEVNGHPVWEVWFWHPLLRRWFCMSHEHDPRMIFQGVVYFRPGEVPDQLRERLEYLERKAGIRIDR